MPSLAHTVSSRPVSRDETSQGLNAFCTEAPHGSIDTIFDGSPHCS